MEPGPRKAYFGYKLHSAMDPEFGLIRRIEVTTASVHDSQVDLARNGEVRYADRGFFGSKTNGYDAAMKKSYKRSSLKLQG